MSFVSLEQESNLYHSVSTSRLDVLRDSYGGLINFEQAVVDFRLLFPQGLFNVGIRDRSVLLSYRYGQISSDLFVQAVVTFASGTSRFVSFDVHYLDYSSIRYSISALGVSSVNFPNSQELSVSDTFVLSIQRDVEAEAWQSRFTCLYVSDGAEIPLAQSILSDSRCTFDFDTIPSGAGRIQLLHDGILIWSFAVEFT